MEEKTNRIIIIDANHQLSVSILSVPARNPPFMKINANKARRGTRVKAHRDL